MILAVHLAVTPESPGEPNISGGSRLYDLLDVGVDNHVFDVEFSPDGTLLAATTHGDVALVGIDNLHPQEAVSLTSGAAATEVLDLTFSPDGTLLALVGVFKGTDPFSYFVEIWDIATKTDLADWDFKEEVDKIKFSPNGCFLALSGPQLWRVQ